MTVDDSTQTHKWLRGLYAPLTEELTAFELPVTGQLPAELDGRYLRNGPNPVGPVDPATFHWFTGDGMVHGIRLRDGRAEWYRNRWVRSTAVSDGPRRGAQAGGAPRRHGHRQHQRDRARRAHVRHRRGRRAAGRAVRRAGDDLPQRPRRHAAQRLHGPPEGRSGDGCPARHRLPLGPPAPAVHRRRRRRAGQPGRADRGRRRPDGPRLLDHRALDGRLRPARAVRSRRRDGRRQLPVPLERGPRRPGRARAARRPRRRRALVRGGAVLRVPPAERVRRRRPRRARRRPLRPHVRPQPAVPRGGSAAAVALDARHRNRPRPRAAAVGRPTRVPARRRAGRRSSPHRGLGIGRRTRRHRQRLRWSPGAHRRRHW